MTRDDAIEARMNGSIQEQVEVGIEKSSEKLSTKIIDGIKGLVSSKELIEARASIEKLTGQVTELQGQVTAREAEIQKLQDAAVKVASDHQAAIAAKDVEITNAKGSAGKQAAEMTAGQGIPAKDAPAGGAASGNASADARKSYAALLASDPRAAGEFYAKNKDLIWG